MRQILGIITLALLAGCTATNPGPAPTTASSTIPAAPAATAPARSSTDPVQVDILLGSTAKRLCSSVFVSGRSREHVLAHELSDPALAAITFSISGDVVKASLGDQAATVLHRPGIGCTLALGKPVETLRAQFSPALYPRVTAPDAPWPLGNAVTLPDSVEGINLGAINEALAHSFEDLEPNQKIGTRAALVIYQGRIIAEQYGDGFDANTPQLGWSMTKTVTNLLTGMLVGDGKLDITTPAPVAAWQADGDPRGSITLNNLLQMSSGLAFSEVYTAGALSDVILMLYTAEDTGGFTAARPLEFEPGTHWYYSSGTTNIISKIQRSRFRSQQDYFNFPRERLFNPLGMASAVIEPDASGVFVGSSYMYATPRDWAKIGLLLLRDGVWNGRRLLPPGWVDYTLTPADAAPRGGYGSQVWLNAGSIKNPTDLPLAGLPPSTYYLSGFEGQNVVVVPELDLIVVRMGLTTGGPRPIWNLVRDVIAAFDQPAQRIRPSPAGPF